MRRVFDATWVALLLHGLAGCADSGEEGVEHRTDDANPGLAAGGASGAPDVGTPGGEAPGGNGPVGAGGAGQDGGAGAEGGAPVADRPGPFPGPPGSANTTAVALDDPAILAWASGVAELELGAESTDEAYHIEANALGPATGATTDVLVLGDAGSATLTFDVVIANGEGFDFAVFENALTDTFLELAYVEVSSDGTHFARFASTYLGTEPVASFGAHDARDIDGLAGKYPVGYGTPFDLASLQSDPEVEAGRVDLDHVTHVRVVDVVGDGSALDSHDRPIYDPYPTVDTAGFDLEAVAVLNAAP
jgi:hypothetical protein